MVYPILFAFQSGLLAAILLVGAAHGAPDKAPPVYGQPYEPYASYKEVCTQKEWSSDSELCMPPLEQECEQAQYDVSA